MASIPSDEKLSKFMSYVLRHHASDYGLKMDKAGYVSTDELLKVINKNYNTKDITLDVISKIVETNDKKRYSFSDEKKIIRANQGHSTETATKIDPNSLLKQLKTIDEINSAVHGTDYKSWLLIKESSGLKKMDRQFIHLAKGLPGDIGVISGMRKSCTVRIYVDLEKMFADGIKVWLSENDVILTDGIDGLLSTKYFKEVYALKKGVWEKIM